MNELLFHYERVNPTSWAYLSSLLTIALFFKFNRIFCMRNLDLLLVILLAPGLLCIEQSLRGTVPESIERVGYVWLLAVNGLLLLRLLHGLLRGLLFLGRHVLIVPKFRRQCLFQALCELVCVRPIH